MRKVTVELKIKLQLSVDEGIEISDIVNELEYFFSDTTGTATIEDETIEDFVAYFNEHAPYQDKYLNTCLAGKEYENKSCTVIW